MAVRAGRNGRGRSPGPVGREGLHFTSVAANTLARLLDVSFPVIVPAYDGRLEEDHQLLLHRRAGRTAKGRAQTGDVLKPRNTRVLVGDLNLHQSAECNDVSVLCAHHSVRLVDRALGERDVLRPGAHAEVECNGAVLNVAHQRVDVQQDVALFVYLRRDVERHAREEGVESRRDLYRSGRSSADGCDWSAGNAGHEELIGSDLE